MQCASRRPSGQIVSPSAEPPTGGNNQPPDDTPHHVSHPILISLNSRTIIWITGPAIAAVLTAMLFYANTTAHINSEAIHVQSETKVEAKAARKIIMTNIIAQQHNAIEASELRQGKALTKMDTGLRKEQRLILREIRAVRRQR